MKKHGIRKLILFIVDFFASEKRFSVYIKPSSGHLNMWCFIFWILLSFFFFRFSNETKKWESFNIQFPLVALIQKLRDVISVRNLF